MSIIHSGSERELPMFKSTPLGPAFMDISSRLDEWMPCILAEDESPLPSLSVGAARVDDDWERARVARKREELGVSLMVG